MLLSEGRRVAAALLAGLTRFPARLASAKPTRMLTVTDLACARGGVPVLEGVASTLSPGEVLMLRGPNGIGKTTLLRTLAGLQPALAGTVDVAPDSIAYGAHADGLKATLTVTENLAFWAGVYGTGDIDAALEAFDLAHLRDRLAQNLSAGSETPSGPGAPAGHRPPDLGAGRADRVAGRCQRSRCLPPLSGRTLRAGGAALIATHIDLGFEARELDVTQFRAKPPPPSADAFDEAFL